LAPILSIAEDRTVHGIGVTHRHDGPLELFEDCFTPGGAPGMGLPDSTRLSPYDVQIVVHG
jgi:hypothetical protein